MAFLRKFFSSTQPAPERPDPPLNKELGLESLRQQKVLLLNRKRELIRSLSNLEADIERLTDDWAAARCNGNARQREDIARQHHFLRRRRAWLDRELGRLEKSLFVLDTGCMFKEQRELFAGEEHERKLWSAIHDLISDGLAEEKAEDYRLDETLDQIGLAEHAAARVRESWQEDEMAVLDQAVRDSLSGNALASELDAFREKLQVDSSGQAQQAAAHWQDVGVGGVR